MILLDACILIDYGKGKDTKLVGLVESLPLVVCGVTRTELLRGARTPAERQAALDALNYFPNLPTPETIWDTVGDNLAALRAAGVTVPFPDAVLATLAIVSSIELWTRDKHFTLMLAVLPGLRLFAEPP